MIAGFAFAAVVLTLRYGILPRIDEYRDDIARALSQATHQRITIGKLSANWDGLRPELVLEDVTVFDAADHAALRLARVANTLSWLSLPALEPRFHSIEIHRPALVLRRDAGGRIWVAGMELKPEYGGGFAEWLMRQREVIVDHASISWHDELRGAAPLELREVDLLLRNRGARHRFGVRAVPPAALAGPLDVRGDFSGSDIAAFASWKGRLFVQVDKVDIDGWRAWLPALSGVSRGMGAVRVWLGLADSAVNSVVADIRLADFKAQLEPDLSALELGGLDGRLAWRGTGSSREFSTTGLRVITADGVALRPMDFRLRLGQQQGELQANVLELTPLLMLADRLPLGAALRENVAAFSPQGNVFDLALRWNGEWSAPSQFSVHGRFRRLGAKAHGGIPGFSGLNGTLEASEKAGSLYLESAGVMLDMPLVFRAPLGFDSVVAQLAWSRGNHGVDVRLDRMALSNAHLEGTVSGTYRWTGAGRGIADMRGALTRAEARYVGQYVPLVIGAPTREWLDTSILAGKSNDVTFRLKGNLDQFPFPDDKGGVLRVVANVTGGVLEYASGWPKIEGISASIVFHGREMDVDAKEGSILGARLSKVHAEIPDVVRDYEILHVNGEATGPTGEFLSFIEKSPVYDMIDRFTEGMRAEGDGRLALQLEMPLREREKSKLAGTYRFSDNRITASDALPPLTDASGRIEFTESSVRMPRTSAVFLGGPVTLSAAAEEDSTVRITAQGRADIAALQRTAESPWWIRYLHGAADWNGTMRLHKKLADLTVESDLRGIASDLPAPLAKPADSVMPLRIERMFTGAQSDEVSVAYGDVIGARFVRKLDGTSAAIQRGTVQFGGAAPPPQREGVWVSGGLNQVDLDRWRAFARKAEGGGSMDLAGFDVKLGELVVLNRSFHDVALKGTLQDGVWRTALAAHEFEGTATWEPAGKGKLTARMRRLAVPASGATPATPAEKSAGQRPDLPALDVVVDQFQFKDKPLGKLELAAVPEGRDWRIKRIHIANPDSVLTADGLLESTVGEPRTRVHLRLDAGDIGKVFARLGLPEGVRGGTAKLEGSLVWPGGPQDFDYGLLSGTLALEAVKGQFVKIEPGIGKLLGILSLQALPRRITLDFRDVFSEGFAFDQIVGTVKITDGVAMTDNFVMLGPAARVLMTGQVDLGRETQTLHVRVAPHLSDSVSIASGLVGGPIAFVATLLAQRLLKDPLGQMVAYEYDVSGTWADPEVKKVERSAAPARGNP